MSRPRPVYDEMVLTAVLRFVMGNTDGKVETDGKVWAFAREPHEHMVWVEQQTGHRRCALCKEGCFCGH